MRRKAQHGTATIPTMKKSVEFKGELNSIPISLLLFLHKNFKGTKFLFSSFFIFMHKKVESASRLFLVSKDFCFKEEIVVKT